MKQFQPGEIAYIDVTFENPVPIKNAYVIFVHEGDEDQHIVMPAEVEETTPLPPSRETTLFFEYYLPKDTKPGVYALDEINFETVGGNTVGYQAKFSEDPKLEVIPERDVAPLIVRNVSIERSEERV